MSRPSVPAAQTDPATLSPDVAGSEAATRVRYRVLAFLAVMTFVLYLDRVCIAQARESISGDLGLTDEQMGYVFAAFTIAYGLFEIPTGRLGDRFGSRRVLTRIVVWWSLFTALTGAAFGFVNLLVVRFLFGAGEAGGLPNAARVIERWFPISSRGAAHGVITTAMMIGGGLAPMTAAWLIWLVGWRWSFVFLAAIGCAWAAAFALWFRETPAEHPHVNDAERRLIDADRSAAEVLARGTHEAVPWRAIFRSPTAWVLAALISCAAAVVYVFTYWFPAYLASRELDSRYAGFLASMVLLGGAAGCACGGVITDRITGYFGDRRAGYRLIGCAAYALATGALLVALMVESPLLASIFFALSCFAIHVQVPAWWGSVTVISGRHTGVVFGLLNSMGVPAAAASQIVPGTLASRWKAEGFSDRAVWDLMFAGYVPILIAGFVLWMFVNPNRSAVGESDSTG